MKSGFIAITGASSGIGKATASLFVNKGFNVLLLARRQHLLEEFSGDHVMKVEVDVTDEKALKEAIGKAEERFGAVDLIVNNAGRMLLGDITSQNSAEWKEMYDVNVLGVLNGMQAVLPSMKERQRGTIINIGSIAGRKTFPDHAAYVGTKFAVHAMTENVREEAAGDNIRVTIIAPGVVETELLDHTSDDGIKQGYKDWKASINGGLEPDVVAETVYFAYQQPSSVTIREIDLAPTKQQD
ncbi:SDR family oxidoreductase [Halobacillus kuroshimensis]|uniref:SDR family oxidoreductase n=1 Tax=Halobacillus kuroshimensis TaxID=302481 RepID=A0ABS3E0Q3_9BACI|nr:MULTISPECIES: SDR family oxidoreductase [Halobacillus]MBN8237171.1 SDR family oxidoreductase [Halobacillus kuroshimensis]